MKTKGIMTEYYFLIGTLFLWGICYMALRQLASKSGQYIAGGLLFLLVTTLLFVNVSVCFKLAQIPRADKIMNIQNASIIGVKYDETKKALVGTIRWNGRNEDTVLKKANEIDENNNLYTEECLREAAKNYGVGKAIRIIHQPSN